MVYVLSCRPTHTPADRASQAIGRTVDCHFAVREVSSIQDLTTTGKCVGLLFSLAPIPITRDETGTAKTNAGVPVSVMRSLPLNPPSQNGGITPTCMVDPRPCCATIRYTYITPPLAVVTESRQPTHLIASLQAQVQMHSQFEDRRSCSHCKSCNLVREPKEGRKQCHCRAMMLQAVRPLIVHFNKSRLFGGAQVKLVVATKCQPHSTGDGNRQMRRRGDTSPCPCCFWFLCCTVRDDAFLDNRNRTLRRAIMTIRKPSSCSAS